MLPEQPLAVFARHEQADVPVIVGSTAREFSNLIGPKERTPEMFRDWVQKSYAPVADDVLHMYVIPTPADAREAFIRAATELEMSAPARWAAQAMQGMKSNAYLYEVTWAFPSQGGQQLGAFHGMGPIVDVRLSPCAPRRDWRCFGRDPTRLLDTVCQDGEPEHTRVAQVAALWCRHRILS